MELEEAIKHFENVMDWYWKNSPNRIYAINLEDFEALRVILHYIKEESIPRAVVEDRVKELKLIREEEEKTRFVLSYSIYNAITNEIDDLEEILNKGE